MLEKFLISIRSRKGILILAALSCALLISAVLVGIGDNIPGIVLVYLAVTVLFVALVRNWRELKKFLILMGASSAGFVVFVLLHNALYGLVYVMMLNRPDLDEPFFFVLAVFVCPVGFLVGVVGSVVLFIKRRRAG